MRLSRGQAPRLRVWGISSPAGVGASAGVVPASARVGWRDAQVGGWPHLPPGITQLGLDPLAWGKRDDTESLPLSGSPVLPLYPQGCKHRRCHDSGNEAARVISVKARHLTGKSRIKIICHFRVRSRLCDLPPRAPICLATATPVSHTCCCGWSACASGRLRQSAVAPPAEDLPAPFAGARAFPLPPWDKEIPGVPLTRQPQSHPFHTRH